MSKYYIDYCTGAGNEYVNGTLEDAKKIADDGAAYTQNDIKIYEVIDDDMVGVSRRAWCGVAFNDDSESEDPIIFGTFGYYADWVDEYWQ